MSFENPVMYSYTTVPSNEVNKCFLAEKYSEPQFLTNLGSLDEVAMYFDPITRKCYLENNSGHTITFSLKRLDGIVKISEVASGDIMYLDVESIDRYSKSSILNDCSFTSTQDVVGFNYNHECLSHEPYKMESRTNRILCSIVNVPRDSDD